MNNRCVYCFDALSVKPRFKIFNFLKKENKKLTITDLVMLTELKQPTVTFHIDKMVKAGIIKKVRTGRQVYCQIEIKCSPCPLMID